MRSVWVSVFYLLSCVCPSSGCATYLTDGIINNLLIACIWLAIYCILYLLYLVTTNVYTGQRHSHRHNSWLKLLFLIQQQLRLINLKMFALVVVMSLSLRSLSNASISHAACPPIPPPSPCGCFIPPSTGILSSYD